ncbi:hypothetical protein OHA70_11725 [Kribbella sp. NBC_00382]|uniref:hypothetical protein n=1 Tax=Kribbella sp. NBC_00382 TaxID=2975967 RepID=UPI002E24ECDB
MSPRAVDKRARPGNEATPGPAGPPVTTAEFETIEPAEAEVAVEVTDGAKD